MNLTVERDWESFPKQARAFLLETPLVSLNFHGFAKFWLSSSTEVVECSWSLMFGACDATRVLDASLSLALNYLYLGKVKEARALLLNGCFVLECMESGIETIAQWCWKNAHVPCPHELDHFSYVFYYVRTPQAMEALLHRMIRVFHKSSHRDVVEYLSQTESHVTKRQQKPSSDMSTEARIQLIIVDDSIAEEKHILNIGSSTTLKTLFNDYAEQRGVSLRSLRFSYKGKSLFLSHIRNRTPDELKMRDQDVITVCDANNVPRETSSSSKNKPALKKHANKSNNSRKRKNGRGEKQRSKQKDVIKSLEEYKMEHSKLLTSLQEEAQPRLKEIRTRLNALDLECQPPKQKRKNGKKKKTKSNVECQISLSNAGIGGKTGKPYFMVYVGEVQNLYKSTKLPQRGPCKASALDLHGYTRDGALIKLDESLTAWVDTAMRGLYPFVIPVKIVCGCGNQIISQAVEKWIREHEQVANAPKGCI